jgi:hypothetical protein
MRTIKPSTGKAVRNRHDVADKSTGRAARLLILAVAVSTLSCCTSDHPQEEVNPTCQPEHGKPGHDHTKHVAGLPTCP